MNQRTDKNVSSQKTNHITGGERILGRKLARALSQEELTEVFGGHTPPPGGGTCSNGIECDAAI